MNIAGIIYMVSSKEQSWITGLPAVKQDFTKKMTPWGGKVRKKPGRFRKGCRAWMKVLSQEVYSSTFGARGRSQQGQRTGFM